MKATTKLRVLVLEDEWPARNYLVQLVEDSGLGEVVGAVATAAEAREVMLTERSKVAVDVLFADIQLVGEGDRAGLTLVREVSSSASPPAIVLATAFKQHALEAFELGVVDYLLKPFNEERVNACLARIAERLADRVESAPTSPPRIVARKGKSLVFLDPSEVWAFEAGGRLTCVHSAHGTFDVDLSLSTIESSLGKTFARVHRNWLVNGAHIKQLDRDGSETTLFVGTTTAGAQDAAGVTVPVARERAQSIREMLLANATGVRRT